MDSNRTRYRSLVTPADWTERARHVHGALRWNARAGALTLQPFQYEFPSAAGAPALIEEPGRGGVFDAHGNLYALAADRLSIRILSAGSRRDSTFWPVGDAAAQAGVAEVAGLGPHPALDTPAPRDGSFGPAAAPARWPTLVLDALTVTTQHYLVVACAAAGGLIVFDLHGAGAPWLQPWPGLGAVQALVAWPGGGVGVLSGNRLLLTDASLRPCLPTVPAEVVFTPLPPAPAPPPAAPQSAPLPSIDLEAELPAGAEAAAVLPWPAGLLVLWRHPAEEGALWLAALDRERRPLALIDEQPSPPPPVPVLELGPLIRRATLPDEQGRRKPRPLAARAAAIVRLADDADGRHSLFVLSAAGDQAFRFSLQAGADGVRVALQPEFWPLRRYQGAGLAALPDGLVLHDAPDARLFHASPGGWVPMLELERPRYARADDLLTPVWDGGSDGCVWHRLMLDLRLPSGTEVAVDTRAVDGAADADEARTLIEQVAWRAEPALAVHPQGSELPWQSGSAPGWTTRDVLLQAARGRWFQARLRIRGDGQRTPSLRALRAWAPRFSYPQRYLPPLYREDAAGADFLERLLALFEGEFTRWEDRIAMAQLLADARTAPAELLPWLAGWVALALDPAETDPVRRRLLIRHAVTGHARRGTVPGLLLAATLAWEPVLDEDWLRDPAALATRRHGVRLQEFFGLAGALPSGAWRPTQGHGALLAALGGDAALAPAAGEPGAARRSVLNQALGFVPRAAVEEAALWQAWHPGSATVPPLPADLPAPGDERTDWLAYLQASQPCAALRQRWQAFLSRRWRRISALNAAWGTRWGGFAQIPSPVSLPGADSALADWHRFESQVLRLEPYAHRFRVVLPLPEGALDLDTLNRRRGAVQRAVQRDQPAHTVSEVRFGFELFRVGEARLGLDTLLDDQHALQRALGALGRRPILGSAELGQARLETSRPPPPADRVGLDRGVNPAS